MLKPLLLYALALAVGAFLLQWLDYKYVTHVFAPQLYIALIAAAFTALGLWAGHRLTARSAPDPFTRNAAAQKSLGLTEREIAVLEHIASGHATKEIARALDISPNTVKTHIANLFQKLDAQRRTQAVQKARALRLIA